MNTGAVDENTIPSPTRFERSHFARRDLDWLPRSLRWFRWAITASVFGVLALALGAAASLVGRVPLGIGLLFFGFAVAATMVGDSFARSAMHARLRRMTRAGAAGRRRRGGRMEERVCVRGKVVARECVDSLLGDGRGVYRRALIDLDGVRAVHETACDFLVVDADGERVLVKVAGARLVDPDDRVVVLAGGGERAARLLRLPWPEALDSALHRRGMVRDDDGTLRYEPAVLEGFAPGPVLAAETLVADGDEVEVAGIERTALDPQATDHGLREAPIRTTLHGRSPVPLLITVARVK